MQAVILAAGKGTRMKSDLPKVLHSVLGWPVLEHVLKTLRAVGVEQPCVVIGNGADQLRSFLKNYRGKARKTPQVAMQREQRGTGHAVMMAQKSLGSKQDLVLIWPGDMPLLKASTLRAFIASHKKENSEVSVLSSLQVDPTGYGRILRAGGNFFGIREEVDATEAERRIQEVNTGVYLFRKKTLFQSLKKIRPTNKKNELYLTDVIEILSEKGFKTCAFPFAAPEEGQGINNRKDLARANEIMNLQVIEEHMANGVTFIKPDQTYVARNVKIGKDTVVHPWSYIESDVLIGKKCEIGPFAKIKSGTRIKDQAVIGSFVEINRSEIGNKVIAKHLAYLGDAVIEDEVNIGAGCITANFDGKKKYKTRIGRKSMLGSNTVLVAPTVLESDTKTGAGAVVVKGKNFKKGDLLVGVPARVVTKRKTKKRD